MVPPKSCFQDPLAYPSPATPRGKCLFLPNTLYSRHPGFIPPLPEQNKTTFFRQINPRLMRVLDVAGYERFYTIVVVCLWVVWDRDRGGHFGSGTKSISGCRLKPSSRLKTSFIIFIETDFKVGHEKLFHKIEFRVL
jgi:hypothetical protein